MRLSVRGDNEDDDDELSRVRGFIIVLNRETLRDYGTITRAAICNAHHWPSQCDQRVRALNIPPVAVCYAAAADDPVGRPMSGAPKIHDVRDRRIPSPGRRWFGPRSRFGLPGKFDRTGRRRPRTSWSHCTRCRVDANHENSNNKICRLCRYYRSPRHKRGTMQ
ncbi:unnamed protein product [Macrosiphum euphorbiae]|uniref:Uncharacterized protein n=1 Tax=Macrosiphum euphorbiae TaxID=13131 RepID=A0AAV0XFK9_9HEMI|nr:unnamed protein product [Macrosiphum euphorbiae]